MERVPDRTRLRDPNLIISQALDNGPAESHEAGKSLAIALFWRYEEPTVSAHQRIYLAMALLSVGGPFLGCTKLRRPSTLGQLAESREFLFEGQAQARTGDWQQAEALYREAVDACPQDERAHGHLADSLWNLGRTQEALTSQLKAVELSPGETRHRLRLGEMYIELGQGEQALAQAEAVLKVDRFSAAAWNLKGQALVSLRRNDDALAVYQRSLAIDQSQTWVYEQIATLYEIDQKPQRALATWQTIEDMYGRDEVPAPILYHQAMALNELNRGEEAIEQLVRARRHDPDSMEILALLAQLQWQAGDRGSAQLTLAHLRNRWPDHPEVEAIAQRWRSDGGSDRVVR